LNTSEPILPAFASIPVAVRGCDTSRVDVIPETRHHFIVRTTLTLDDDVFELAAGQAKLRGVSLGKTVSDLVRRGLNSPTLSENQDGIVVFRLPADSPKVTTEDVRRLETEGA
jgi:hypothetical protein